MDAQEETSATLERMENELRRDPTLRRATRDFARRAWFQEMEERRAAQPPLLRFQPPHYYHFLPWYAVWFTGFVGLTMLWGLVHWMFNNEHEGRVE